jgi:cytochrome P450
MEPGATPPVDEYPFLRFIPAAWAPWKRKALIAGKAVDDLWTEARRRLEVRRATGVRRNCVSDMILDDWEGKGSWPISQREFNLTLGEFVSGGADTTASQLLTLVLAFAKYPHVQEKARKELDAVCGTSRAPVWDDFSRLPYINATVKEGMRWRPT